MLELKALLLALPFSTKNLTSSFVVQFSTKEYLISAVRSVSVTVVPAHLLSFAATAIVCADY